MNMKNVNLQQYKQTVNKLGKNPLVYLFALIPSRNLVKGIEHILTVKSFKVIDI